MLKPPLLITFFGIIAARIVLIGTLFNWLLQKVAVITIESQRTWD